MNVIGLIERQASIRPHAPAIIDVHRGRERSLTFGELYEQVARIAALLESQGIDYGVVPPGRGWLVSRSLGGTPPYRAVLQDMSANGLLRKFALSRSSPDLTCNPPHSTSFRNLLATRIGEHLIVSRGAAQQHHSG